MNLEVFLSEHVRKSPQQNCFFHFTDRKNLASIQAHGLLSLRSCRSGGVAITVPGGNDWSREADERVGMDRYVHLCFMNEHPMAYAAQQQDRIKEIVWLRIRPEVILISGVLMSSEVSNKSGVRPEPAADMLDKIDLQVIYTRTEWTDPAIKARLDLARKYEILVPDRVPLNYILNPNG